MFIQSNDFKNNIVIGSFLGILFCIFCQFFTSTFIVSIFEIKYIGTIYSFPNFNWVLFSYAISYFITGIFIVKYFYYPYYISLFIASFLILLDLAGNRPLSLFFISFAFYLIPLFLAVKMFKK